MELYHHPIGAIRAALAQGSAITDPRKEGNDDVVDITTADGSKLTLYVDSQTKLPSKVTTMTDNLGGPLGDVVIENVRRRFLSIESNVSESKSNTVYAGINVTPHNTMMNTFPRGQYSLISFLLYNSEQMKKERLSIPKKLIPTNFLTSVDFTIQHKERI